MTGTPQAIVPDHLLDLDEWDALDHHEVYRRAELVEGVLVMAPSRWVRISASGRGCPWRSRRSSAWPTAWHPMSSS